MFSGEKFLIIFVTLMIIGAGVYVGAIKLKEDILPSNSPVPSSSPLQFINHDPATVLGSDTGLSNLTQGLNFNLNQIQNNTTQELPYSKNKKVTNPAWLNKSLKPEYLANKKAVIQTAKGTIQFEIYPEASISATNFIMLASNGFYDGLTFHRVEKGFVIQGGDPDGNGTGGPGYQFPDEPVTKDYYRGIVAYANAGPNTNGSQFFIMLEDHLNLPKRYVIFGKVFSGMEVVEKITPGDIMQKVFIQNLN